jgi:hypothetical protein
MPRLFEVFGYPVDDTSPQATAGRRAARCPFLGRACDGGGNRYSSSVNVNDNALLKAFFDNHEKVCVGVLSLMRPCIGGHRPVLRLV